MWTIDNTSLQLYRFSEKKDDSLLAIGINVTKERDEN